MKIKGQFAFLFFALNFKYYSRINKNVLLLINLKLNERELGNTDLFMIFTEYII